MKNLNTKECFKHLSRFFLLFSHPVKLSSESNSSHLHRIELFPALSFNCVVILINNFSFAERLYSFICSALRCFNDSKWEKIAFHLHKIYRVVFFSSPLSWRRVLLRCVRLVRNFMHTELCQFNDSANEFIFIFWGCSLRRLFMEKIINKEKC